MAALLVIFDCDGVLVDSEPIAAQVLREALAQLGLNDTLEEVDTKYRGRSLLDIVASIETELGEKVPDTFVDDLSARTREAFDRELRPMDGVNELLFELTRRNVSLCVASSGTPEKIKHSLGRTGLLEYFEDRLFSSLMVDRGKPAPDLFIHTAKVMGHGIERSVVIEDSVPGVTGAVAAGARVLAYVAPRLLDLDERRRHMKSLGAQPFHMMDEVPALLPT